jgi:hypothetical protein
MFKLPAMKITLNATLPLLAALCLATGCHKNTETSSGPVDNPSSRDAGMPAADSGMGMGSGTTTGMGGPQGDTGAPSPAREACVDRWLQEHKLDRYGNAEGTMYTGGSPLFNESTGETIERLAYVFQRQPDAQKACPASSAQ